VEDQFGKYRNWDQIMSQNGPFDEPNACYEQGRIFLPNGLRRQAAYQFDRTKTLAPDNLSARLWLAQLYIVTQMPERALKLIAEIHEQPDLLKITRTNQNEMLFIEASAHLAAHDLPGAQAAVSSILKKYPADEGLLSTATQLYMNYSFYSNALTVIDKQLQLDPNNLSALVNKGFSSLQINAYDQAIPPLTRVLTIQSNYYPALLNRAIAYLRSDKLDAARHDYEVLQKALPTEYRIYYGLGEIAYRKRETNAAIRSYQLYLTNSPPDTEEAKTINARLKELKPGSR
jgi:tetratricopeptide (TPR) repeat protein